MILTLFYFTEYIILSVFLSSSSSESYERISAYILNGFVQLTPTVFLSKKSQSTKTTKWVRHTSSYPFPVRAQLLIGRRAQSGSMVWCRPECETNLLRAIVLGEKVLTVSELGYIKFTLH